MKNVKGFSGIEQRSDSKIEKGAEAPLGVLHFHAVLLVKNDAHAHPAHRLGSVAAEAKPR